MDEVIPCQQRVFPLKLATWFMVAYQSYLRWLQTLIERLGREHALVIWEEAFRDYDDTALQQILVDVWWEDKPQAVMPTDLPGSITERLIRFFPAPLDGFTAKDAEALVEKTPPIPQIRRHFHDLDVIGSITTYDALHVGFDGVARLAETLIAQYGETGELIAYDIMLAEVAEDYRRTGTVGEFMAYRAARYSTPCIEHDIFSAGRDVELIAASDTEVVSRVTYCEWARYFHERHPTVGYLIACSKDAATYRAFNKNIRLQRTHTLMQGADSCDFRVYSCEPETVLEK